MFKKWWKIAVVVSLALFIGVPTVFAACTMPTGGATYLLSGLKEPCYCYGNCDLCDLLSVGVTGVNMILSLAAIIALVLFIYGATWFWLLSAGDQNKIKTGKSLITNTVIALVIILGAYSLVNFVYSSLKGESFKNTYSCELK